MVNDQGAKRLILLGNFESLSLIKTSRCLRVHPCRHHGEAGITGSSARTVSLTIGLTLHRKLRSRDRSKAPKAPYSGSPNLELSVN